VQAPIVEADQLLRMPPSMLMSTAVRPLELKTNGPWRRCLLMTAIA
jgi:hypothetical protein